MQHYWERNETPVALLERTARIRRSGHEGLGGVCAKLPACLPASRNSTDGLRTRETDRLPSELGRLGDPQEGSRSGEGRLCTLPEWLPASPGPLMRLSLGGAARIGCLGRTPSCRSRVHERTSDCQL